ncbi:alpha/beta hydrolase domain-containing protein 14B [Striga asiatica]|uniref:Alpha/beta hydrolase domain-containing protein 14B n=1 Tax=Striga asiatica TaxID=4170 RepID=A0A5A7QZL9_STRAF|nr:alpha/beta hydrolase domain-containing protein 14B [Striga asiatica]
MSKTTIKKKVEIKVHLMKSKFLRQWHPNLTNTSTDLLIRPVKIRIPVNAPVEHPNELRGQRIADREARPSVAHSVRVHHVLLHAFRDAPDIIHPLVIVFSQNARQILGEKNRVVIAHHEPPHVRLPELEALLHNSSHSNS